MTTQSDAGEYNVRVESQMQNFYKNTTYMEFLVVIYELPDNDWSLQPQFEVILTN